ncbi:MAG: hypothetical protein WEB09_06905 [Nitriliruptor sp.]
MSLSPGLDAPDTSTTPPADTTPTPPSDRDGTSGGRLRGRGPWIVALLAVLGLIAGSIAIQQVRNADAEARAAEQREARAELAAELGDVRRAIAEPARDGQNTATALLRHQLALVAGDTPDPELGDGLVADLRTAADELDEVATTPLPDRPQILPVATVDPIFARLEGLEQQASDLAGTYRSAADEAEGSLESLRALEAAAITYAGSSDQLPSGDDPDAIAAAWEAERDRLATYDEAVTAAAERPSSAPLAEAHRSLVDGMSQLADDAIELLGADDLDAYNALLADQLGGEDPFGFAAQLADARAEVADTAVDGPLEDARARGLGLLTELEELRRITPAQLAEVR